MIDVYEFKEGESVFHLTNDRFFESVVILRVERRVICWKEFNDIANKDIERRDLKENFFPNTKEFLKIVNNINNEKINLESIDNRLDAIIYNARVKLKKRFE